jgi:methyl-accepting chemotaxis protein
LIFISSEILDKESFAAVNDFKHHYFELFYPLAQSYIDSLSRETHNFPLEEDYLAVAVKTLEKLNDIGEKLELSCTEVSREVIAARLTELLIGIFASISAFLIIFYSSYLLYRRMYVRVFDSAYIMGQLTQGNLSVEIKPPMIPDEIGDLEDGLEKFRENLQTKEKLINELQKTLEEIKTLKGIIPICMHCKEIRDDEGAWNQLEKYIVEHSDAEFSHGICDKCMTEKYGKNMK